MSNLSNLKHDQRKEIFKKSGFCKNSPYPDCAKEYYQLGIEAYENKYGSQTWSYESSPFDYYDPFVLAKVCDAIWECRKEKCNNGKTLVQNNNDLNKCAGSAGLYAYLRFLIQEMYGISKEELEEINGSNLVSDKVKNLIDKIPVKEEQKSANSDNNVPQNKSLKGWPRQIIFYGPPGNGKSHSIKKFFENINIEPIRVTFHPEMDYASFVGAYVPCKDSSDANGVIFDFKEQPFLKAYKKACDTDETVVLLIEEINRGNCAQIFGDIFQLLDRYDTGESKYPIIPDNNIAEWLDHNLEKEEMKFKAQDGIVRMSLPSNLYIWSTMNTSDQSLYPIDSAFTRRWEMRYVPIGNAPEWKIGEPEGYLWKDVHHAINKIMDEENIPDKKLGAHFIRPVNGNEISYEDFVGKVIFYLYKYIFPVYSIREDLMKRYPFDSFYKGFDTETLKNRIAIEQVKKFIGALLDKKNSLAADGQEGGLVKDTEENVPSEENAPVTSYVVGTDDNNP